MAHEKTSKVRMPRLQLRNTKFENMKMFEEETIIEFNVCLCDFSNNSLVLGENMLEVKFVRKIHRSLQKRFDMKVATIDKTQDVLTMKVDELFGSLLTFEWCLKHI